MNLPINKPLLENASLETIDPKELLLDLKSKKFSGYIYLVINDKFGFNENILLFSKGDIFGCIYLNEFFNKQIYGEDAFGLIKASFGKKSDGLLSIYNLTSDQVKLTLIFNDKIKYVVNINKKTIKKMDFKYSEEYFKKALNIKKEVDTKHSLLNKYQLNELLEI